MRAETEIADQVINRENVTAFDIQLPFSLAFQFNQGAADSLKRRLQSLESLLQLRLVSHKIFAAELRKVRFIAVGFAPHCRHLPNSGGDTVALRLAPFSN